MIVGLTGGIGSGKSTVGMIFRQLGVPVYEADLAAREILDLSGDLQQELVTLMGGEVLKDGKIDRPYMASRIFKDNLLLQKVNALIHPAVAQHFSQWQMAQAAPWVLKEAAILFESGSYRQCDEIIVVYAPREMRVQRVMARGGQSRTEVEERMAQQWDDERKMALADHIIHNDHTEALIPQILRIYEDIERRAKETSRPADH